MEVWCRGSFIEIVNRQRAGRSGIRIQVGGNLCILQNIQTSSCTHTASYSIGTEALYRGKAAGA